MRVSYTEANAIFFKNWQADIKKKQFKVSLLKNGVRPTSEHERLSC